MATARTTSVITTATTLFTTPEHQRGVITGLNIDNQYSTALTLILQDVFTTDASNGASATTVTDARLQITVAAGQSVSVDRNSLENIKILGICKMLGSATSTLCVIIVNYNFE